MNRQMDRRNAARKPLDSRLVRIGYRSIRHRQTGLMDDGQIRRTRCTQRTVTREKFGRRVVAAEIVQSANSRTHALSRANFKWG